MRSLIQWTTIVPTLAWILLFSGLIPYSGLFKILASLLLILSVMSAVHHSEIIALKIGEPYGTITLAIAITVIEVSIIISIMISGGNGAVSIARDTVYSATMLILNGIVGFCLFIGGLKHHVQTFSRHSVIIALVSLVSILMFTLVFPTFTSSIEGPYYSNQQLIFVSIACLIIYSAFLFAQTSRHREYFLSIVDEKKKQIRTISKWTFITSFIFLCISLGIVVLLAKSLSPAIESIVLKNNLPIKLVGVLVAAIILLPEGAAAIIAAKNNRLQSSLNLALGSALASVGLTIPAVAVVCSIFDMKIILGLDIISILLLGLSVFTVMLSLVSGRSNIIYGFVLLVNLMFFVFLIIHP